MKTSQCSLASDNTLLPILITCCLMSSSDNLITVSHENIILMFALMCNKKGRLLGLKDDISAAKITTLSTVLRTVALHERSLLSILNFFEHVGSFQADSELEFVLSARQSKAFGNAIHEGRILAFSSAFNY